MEEVRPVEFTPVPEYILPALQNRDAKECLVQWNLDSSLVIQQYKYTCSASISGGRKPADIVRDFMKFIASEGEVVKGTPTVPMSLKMETLSTKVLTMDFFDRLQEKKVIESSGSIRGCYEESYAGILVADKLKEMMLNADSEHANLFSESDQKELLFQIFKLFVIGGPLNQSDTNISRYFDLTKKVYKDLLSVFKSSDTQEIKVANSVFSIESFDGVELHGSSDHCANLMVVNVDPVKKTVLLLKNTIVSFW